MAKKEPLKIGMFAAMGHTDVADASSRTGDSNGCIHRLLRADALHPRFRSPSRHLDHFTLGLLTATRDEVGCAETACQFQAAPLMAQQENALGSQASCCQHPTQAHGPIADDGNRFPRMHICRYGCIMACSHHVRQRKNSLEQRFILINAGRNNDQRGIGKGGTNSFGLSSIMILSPKAAMQAVGVESFVAELAGAVGKGKRGDYPISPLGGRDYRSRVFHHSHPFMAQPSPWWKRF